MKISNSLADAGVLQEIGARLAAARLKQNLTQAQLAEQAGVSKRTLERLESGAVATQLSTFVRVLRALGLQDRLELLLPESAPSPLAELKLKGRMRQRASGRNGQPAKSGKPWNWQA